LLHRNLKPSNILLCADGAAVVADMAMSRDRAGALAGPDPDMSLVSYVSPEQRAGDELTPASDIYALGVMLYQACTGRLPFETPDGRRLYDEAPSPRSLNPGVEPMLDAVVMRCLAGGAGATLRRRERSSRGAGGVSGRAGARRGHAKSTRWVDRWRGARAPTRRRSAYPRPPCSPTGGDRQSQKYSVIKYKVKIPSPGEYDAYVRR